MEGPHPIFRWIFAIGCFGVSASLVRNGTQELNPSQIALGILFLTVGITSIFTKLLEIACRPAVMMVDAIFFPGGKLSKPIKNLKLPAYYEKEMRLEEALAEYEKVIRYYPDEPIAYEGAIRILIREFDDYPAAEKLFARSQRRNLVLSDEAEGFFPATQKSR